MSIQVIILNGGSSSGKTSIARALQDILADAWLALSVDDLVDAMPARLRTGGDGIGFGETGKVEVGDTFRALDTAWSAGIAAMARAGAHVIIDDVFLGGPASQERWRTALTGLDVVWVGVRCDPRVAAAREAARPDRAGGMAQSQAETVHRGIDYDLSVDSTTTSAQAVAAAIRAAVEPSV